MGRGLLQHVAIDLLQAAQPQDPHDSAHILSGTYYKCFRYMVLIFVATLQCSCSGSA